MRRRKRRRSEPSSGGEPIDSDAAEPELVFMEIEVSPKTEYEMQLERDLDILYDEWITPKQVDPESKRTNAATFKPSTEQR